MHKRPGASKTPRVSEADIQRQILETLAWRHVFHYRTNSGAFRNAQGHLFRFGASGAPDIVAVVNGRYVGIEVKASGGKLRDSQDEFRKNLMAAGGLYVVARSMEDVDAALSTL